MDGDVVGDAVFASKQCGALSDDGLFVDRYHHRVGRDDTGLSFGNTPTNVVVDDIFQVVGVDARALFDGVKFASHLRFYLKIIKAFTAVVDIFIATPSNGQGRRLIGLPFHLVSVPVGLQIAEVADAGVGAFALHLLSIPKREGVVVAIGEDDGHIVFGQGVEIVKSEVATSIASGAVVVVPRLAHHLNGHEQ